jgi:hypothetical protein
VDVLFEVGGIFGFLLIAFWVWALIDCIGSDPAEVRNLPRFGWLVIVILLFAIGALLWVLLGRPPGRRVRPAGAGLDAPARRAAAVEEPPRPTPEISDRRSAELDERLAAWERQRDLEAGKNPTDDA